MSRNNTALRLVERLSDKEDAEPLTEGIARTLQIAFSNGCKGVIKPSDFNSVEEQKIMSQMIKRGLLTPTQQFLPEPLRYVVTELGMQHYEKLVEEGYYRRNGNSGML